MPRDGGGFENQYTRAVEVMPHLQSEEMHIRREIRARLIHAIVPGGFLDDWVTGESATAGKNYEEALGIYLDTHPEVYDRWQHANEQEAVIEEIKKALTSPLGKADASKPIEYHGSTSGGLLERPPFFDSLMRAYVEKSFLKEEMAGLSDEERKRRREEIDSWILATAPRIARLVENDESLQTLWLSGTEEDKNQALQTIEEHVGSEKTI